MASADSLYTEKRVAGKCDPVLGVLSPAGQRPDMLRGRDIGKPHVATVKESQLDSVSEKHKDSDYVLVTVNELDLKSPKSDSSVENQVQAATKHMENTTTSEKPGSEGRPIQTIPDGNAGVQAYSVRMAKMATDQLKDANHSKALSDAAKSRLAERSRFGGLEMASESVWIPESEQSEPDSYCFELREKYYKDEL